MPHLLLQCGCSVCICGVCVTQEEGVTEAESNVPEETTEGAPSQQYGVEPEVRYRVVTPLWP